MKTPAGVAFGPLGSRSRSPLLKIEKWFLDNNSPEVKIKVTVIKNRKMVSGR
jgi:hypothetical protein